MQSLHRRPARADRWSLSPLRPSSTCLQPFPNPVDSWYASYFSAEPLLFLGGERVIYGFGLYGIGGMGLVQ